MNFLTFGSLKSLLLASVFLMTVAACDRSEQAPATTSDATLSPTALFTPARPPGEFERVRWIQKTAKALRGGRSLTDARAIDALLKKTDEEIVDAFIAGPEFGDTVLDFNLYVLGFRKDRLREPDGELAWQIFDFASAITSARETAKDGDYFKLFEYEQPMYLPRLKRPGGLEDGDDKLSDEELRRKHHVAIQSGLKQLIAQLKANPGTTLDKSCAMFLEETKEGQQFFSAGYWFSLVDLGFYSNIWYGWILEACTGAVKPAGFDMIVELEKILQMNERLIDDIKNFEPARYSTRDLAEIRALDVKKIGIAPHWNFFGDAIRQSIMNSSTSFNRKRGAWALSRFFCDDLTPIGVETPPGPPPTDRHGSEPACMACHYKLDPMAGFFRDFGYLFSDYSKASHIRFDDNAAMPRDQYQQAWRAQGATGRTWNVGYVRSTTKDTLNSYGSTIEDLFKIVRTEPEVKRCLSRRLFEYLVSDQQALDGGYLDHLAAEFTEAAKTSSARALKGLAKKIVLSHSFRELDPVTDKCYDYPPGYDPAGKPPCKVAHVLKKNCVMCHSSTASFPHLNLGSWVQLPVGTMGFPHLDKQGQQLSSKVTLERVLERITTADTVKRMPMRRHMDPLEREVLFRWTNGMLNPQAAFHLANQEYVCPRAKR